MDSIVSPKGENNERIKGWGMLFSLWHFGVERHVGTPGWELGQVINRSITHTDLHKLNNKLVSA
jgi:hypothetical protein